MPDYVPEGWGPWSEYLRLDRVTESLLYLEEQNANWDFGYCLKQTELEETSEPVLAEDPDSWSGARLMLAAAREALHQAVAEQSDVERALAELDDDDERREMITSVVDGLGFATPEDIGLA